MLAVYKRTGPRRRRLSRVKMRAQPGRLGVRGGRHRERARDLAPHGQVLACS